MEEIISLPSNKKIYFASDFHLGAPSIESSKKRELKIVDWLSSIEKDAHTIFLVGDIFDFWFEYKTTIPRGFIRFQGKLAALIDQGIEIKIFTGNHDLWMFDYFTKELGIPVYRNPKTYCINDKKIYVGHGDGLGPGDKTYKTLKVIFENKLCQWLFRWLHPDIGVKLALTWSQGSRSHNQGKEEDKFLGDKEFLWQYAKELESKNHHDYYVFGHRHLALDLPVGENAKYINIGEWIKLYSFGIFDGDQLSLSQYKMDTNDIIVR